MIFFLNVHFVQLGFPKVQYAKFCCNYNGEEMVIDIKNHKKFK